MSAVESIDTTELTQLEPYRRELTAYCYRMLASPHDAEDAVQDTLVRAWRNLSRFEDRAGLRPWLYRIATNVCLDMLKARRRRALPMDLAPAASGATNWIRTHPRSPFPASRFVSRSSPPSNVSSPASEPCSSCVMSSNGGRTRLWDG